MAMAKEEMSPEIRESNGDDSDDDSDSDSEEYSFLDDSAVSNGDGDGNGEDEGPSGSAPPPPQQKQQQQQDKTRHDNIFMVDKILDIRWDKDVNGEERPLYRVRWRGYKPVGDSWEPEENFDMCRSLLKGFLDLHDMLKAKRITDLEKKGLEPKETVVRHVDILSHHIDKIADKKWKKIKYTKKHVPYYKVLWDKESKEDFTWEPEAFLIHAQDKIEEFKEEQKAEKQREKEARLNLESTQENEREVTEEGEEEEEGGAGLNSDSLRRLQERKFFEDLKKGELVLKDDLYTRVKSRRAKPKKNYKEKRETKVIETRSKNIKRTSRGTKRTRNGIEMEQMGCNNNPELGGGSSIISMAGLREYDTSDVDKSFMKMELHSVSLSKKVFQKAVYANDYAAVFDCLRSNRVPDVNFTSLFLEMARHARRDMALLLAKRVPDLMALDIWGDNALTMAAKQGDIVFAHGLLELGVPLNLRDRENRTSYEVATLYGNVTFIEYIKYISEVHNFPYM